MATITLKPTVCVGTRSGNSPAMKTYPVAASQTFVKGEAVYLNSDGRVAEFTTAIDDATQKCLGIAAQDAPTTTGDPVAVYLADPDNLFESNVRSGASAGTSAIADVGKAFPLVEDATANQVYVDQGNTGSQGDLANIVALSKKDAIGDTNGRVIWHFTDHLSQVAGVSVAT